MTTWPVPNPSVAPEPKPTDAGSNVGDKMILGDGSVWRWTGEDWERQPWSDPHEVRRIHRVVPALDAAGCVVSALLLAAGGIGIFVTAFYSGGAALVGAIELGAGLFVYIDSGCR